MHQEFSEHYLLLINLYEINLDSSGLCTERQRAEGWEKSVWPRPTFRNSQGQEDFAHQWSRWRVNIKERGGKMPLSSVISSDPDAKKKKVPGKRNFPQGKRNHVFSVLRTSLQAPTVPKREKKKKKKRQWCHHPPAWSNVLRGTHTALPAAKTSQKKGKKKDDIITCPGLWPQHCVSHLREPTLLFWTTPTASVIEKEAGRIGVTDGIEIRLSHNAYCEGTFVARGEIISKKSQAAGRGSTWQRKERTDFKEGFKLEPTDRKKKK